MTISPAAAEQIKIRLKFLIENRDKLVIDADTHATDTLDLSEADRLRYDSEVNYYHGRPVSAEDLLAEMKMAEVDIILAWQNPAATVYGGDFKENFNALLKSNKYIFDAGVKYPEKIIPAGWTDPKALGLHYTMELAEICVKEFGFAIIKMNPSQNSFYIDSEPVLELVDHIISMGAVPAFHFGADSEFTPAEGLCRVAERHPEHPLIGVHMGGGGSSYTGAEALYNSARNAGLRYSNIRFILSAKRDTHIESDIITYTLEGEPFSSNLFCGSDAPYGRMTWNFGGYRAMFRSLVKGSAHTDQRVRQNQGLFSGDIAAKYMGGNLAGFMIKAYSSLLARAGISL